MSTHSPPRTGPMTIGELAAVTGVSEHLIRMWERRYALVRPARSGGNYRLYAPTDAETIVRMSQLRRSGVAAAAAAAQITDDRRRRGATPPTESIGTDIMSRLVQAGASLDGDRVHAVLDEVFDRLPVADALDLVLMPYLRDLGERWCNGTASIGEERVASGAVRNRLAALALGWDHGSGPIVVLTSPPGERHDIGLLGLGVLAGQQGWRVRFLGPDLPVDALAHVVRRVRPTLVVISATRRRPLEAHVSEYRALSRRTRLAVGGRGVDAGLADRMGATELPYTLTDAAAALTSVAGRG